MFSPRIDDEESLFTFTFKGKPERKYFFFNNKKWIKMKMK